MSSAMAERYLRAAANTAVVTVMGHGITAVTDLDSLASGANVVGASIDPGAPAVLDATGAYWELLVTMASSPTAGTKVQLFFLPTIDGSNYADGSSSIVPGDVHLADEFILRAVGTQQRIVVPLIQFPPFPFKPVLANISGVAFSSATTHTLRYLPYNRFFTPK